MVLAEALAKKGWSRNEIDHAMRVLHRGSELKSRTARVFESMLYWLALVLAILMSFLMAVLLVPLLMISSGIWSGLALIAFGVSFGFLFEWLHCRLETITEKRYLLAGIFLPAIAIINVYIVTRLSNTLSTLVTAYNPDVYVAIHSPMVVSAVFLISFIAPYLFHKVTLTRRAPASSA